MKYSWNIDQRAAIESGFNVDVIDLSIFALLRDFAAEPGCKKMTENGHTYYLFSWKLVVQQQPVLGLNTKRSVTRRFEKLTECNVIHSHPDNKSLKMMWYRFGDGAHKLMRSTKNENDLTRNNHSHSLGTTIPSTRNENSYNNTIIDNTINDKRERARAKTEQQPIEQPAFSPPPDSAPPPSPQQVGARNAPTVEQMAEYLEDIFLESKWQPRFVNNPPETAEQIHAYYSANGWRVGRSPMKDWQAACRNWLLNNEKYGRKRNADVPNTSPQAKRVVSEDTHRRALAITLSELGITGS